MASRLTARRRTWLLGLAALVVVLVAGASGSWVLWRHFHEGQAMSIPNYDSDNPYGPWRTPAPRVNATPEGPPFVTSVSPNGRYFLDQYGKPLLVHGDSPWALMTKLSPQQARLWFADRQNQGFNAAIISLIGASENGGPSDDGATFDGLLPFEGGDILRWQEPYWERATAYLRMAAEHGITVMLYPIDGWTIGHSFVPKSIGQCRQYGGKLAERFRDLPNIVWMSGGDYFPATKDVANGSDVDHCIDAMMRGIRDADDGRPFSMQLGYDKSISTENPYWAHRVDWNFVYTYYPTHKAMFDAYVRQPAIPAIFAEGNYEGENNQPKTAPTTDETLRRQVLWSLTYGAAGEFYGSEDWGFNDGWEQRLSTPALTQITRLRTLFSTLPWWQLEPDTTNELVTEGHGLKLNRDEPMDVLDNDYVTAARTPDGHLAVIYVPTQRTISVNLSAMAADARAAWVDPASGTSRPVPMSDTFTTPGTNTGGSNDWLLVLQS
jgi:Protein of unknown function (DUF4038)/Putative collagen-binding domain of a collagenase